MEGSPWRQPFLADLTYGEMFRLINRLISGNKLRILEVGCGRGYLSLELARKGHDVLGIDVNEDTIRTAYRTMKSDPYNSGRGRLEYEVSDFAVWNNTEGKFDLVIFSRALHHIPQPAKALEKARSLLGHKGRIICVEYAYDQFDRRSATWFYHVRRILEQAGWFKSPSRLSENLEFSVGEIMEEWVEHGRNENLNRFLDMYTPLKNLFEEQRLSWEPYIFWDVIMDMRIPSTDTEMALARSLSAMERTLVEREAISPVLFCFTGKKSQDEQA